MFIYLDWVLPLAIAPIDDVISKFYLQLPHWPLQQKCMIIRYALNIFIITWFQFFRWIKWTFTFLTVCILIRSCKCNIKQKMLICIVLKSSTLSFTFKLHFKGGIILRTYHFFQSRIRTVWKYLANQIQKCICYFACLTTKECNLPNYRLQLSGSKSICNFFLYL